MVSPLSNTLLCCYKVIVLYGSDKAQGGATTSELTPPMFQKLFSKCFGGLKLHYEYQNSKKKIKKWNDFDLK